MIFGGRKDPHDKLDLTNDMDDRDRKINARTTKEVRVKTGQDGRVRNLNESDYMDLNEG